MIHAKIQGPKCQLLSNAIRQDVQQAKIKAGALVIKLDSIKVDSVTKAKIAVVISNLYDADKLLAEIQEDMKW